MRHRLPHERPPHTHQGCSRAGVVIVSAVGYNAPMTTPRRGWRTFGVRQPGAGADRAERLRFVRDMNARSAGGLAFLLVFSVVIGAGSLVLIVGGIGLLVCVIDVAWLTYQLRRRQGPAA
jgi:hypothetical protein